MRSNASPERIAALLAASLLEAAWITLVYVLVESLTDAAEALLSMPAFAGAALAGIAFGRWAAARGDPHAYRTPLAVVAIALALIGWLLPLGAAAAHVVEDPAITFAMHPGGILLGVAFLRGIAHTTHLADERIAEIALGPGLAAVAGVWLLLSVSGGTGAAWVVDMASTATVTFVTTGLLSIGLARLADLRGAGVRGADRRIWDGVLVGIVAGLLVIALPLSIVIGLPLGGAVRVVAEGVAQVLVIAATPFIWVGALVAWVLYLAIEFLRRAAGGTTTDPGTVLRNPFIDLQGLFGPGNRIDLALGVIPLVVAIVVAFVLVRALVRRPRQAAVDGAVVEVREAEGPIGMSFQRPHLSVRRRHQVPRTASEAYVASLDLLARWPELARLPAETPAAHARRMRAAPIGPPLSRLAADYALVEFGRRTLTPSEHRRAIERWRRIRSTDRATPS
jgi:hypothetical protein